jgi:hypothetical protein
VLVAFVVRGAISDVTAQILLDNSFPETDQKIKYWRDILKQAAAADHRRSEFPPIVDIYERITQDLAFSDALGELVSKLLAKTTDPHPLC